MHPEMPTPWTPSPLPRKFPQHLEAAKAAKEQGAWASGGNAAILNKNCIYKEPKSKCNLALKICGTGCDY